MIRNTLPIFFQFLKRDLLIMKDEYLSKLIDTVFIFFTNVVVFGYFMSKQGLSEDYGPFLMLGAIAIFGLFEVLSRVSILINDLEGEKTISFLLTLPISSAALFCYMGIYWALYATVLSLPLFLIGKILLFTRFDLVDISYWRLLLIFLSGNIFYGFFALWLTGIIKGKGDLGKIYIRFINPIFMFGAYFYSWKNVFALDHLIAYVSLLNPVVYIMEGIRSAALGREDYIPFWITPLAIWAFTFILGSHGIHRIKKRIDCL